MTATIARPKPKKPAASKQQSPYKRLHVIIPIEDMLWASQQKPSVNQLWQECWTSDPYGSRWMPLSTALGYSSFICAKKILSESGLFIFKPDKSIQDGRETVGWMVRNLHGSRMKDFWEKPNAENSDMNAASEEMRCKYTASISDERQLEQGFEKPSRTPQKHLTNSSVEFVRCVSSTQDKNWYGDATADAPSKGASPQTLESVEEKEESPAVTDCTSLTLVDDVPSQSASLLAEKKDLGDDQEISHEDTFSAAPVASGFENSVTQSEEPARHNQPALLLSEKQDMGDEPKVTHEATGSAPSVSEPEAQPDKWSSEAIAQRQKARPWRMEKLRMAGLFKENPGFDFLMECWNDDPALQIVIKGLVRKCPQWGYVVLDGQLMEWERE